jgi:DNA polymerase I-like protein with 3'-5' exonuclease and polymerase domains
MPKASASSTVLDDALAMIENSSEYLALDLETTGLDPRASEIRLVQVSNGEKTYVLDLWKGLDPRPLFEALAKKTVLVHGGDFEWRFIYHHFGIELTDLRDTMLLARLASCGDMQVGVGLGAVAERELNVILDKEMQTSDWSGALTKRHLDYAALDAQVLPRLYTRLEADLSRTDQEHVARIEHEALPAVALMKFVGMPVDKEAWDEYADKVEVELRGLERKMLEAPWMPERDPIPQTWALQGEDCLAMLHAADPRLKDITGTTAKDLKPHQDLEIVKRLLTYRKNRKTKGETREDAKAAVLELAPEKPPAPPPPWNFGSPTQVNEIVYEILGFELDNTDEGSLLRYVGRHPFFEHMLEHRRLKKLVSTYGKGWFKEAYSEGLGRVFPAWRQIGTSTGRFASGERTVAPNAQNLPSALRKFFVAPKGRLFVDADYSQIEVRIAAKMLNETALLELFHLGEDIYTNTAANLLGIQRDTVTKKQRNLAKAIMLGMLYGLSAWGLPYYAFKNYGIETMSSKDAEAYVEAFYELYPKIAAYHTRVLRDLKESGSVDQRTMAGRLRSGIISRNEAINAPIQGTAADGLKAAMALVYKRLKKFNGSAFIIASIHDELLVECEEADAKEILEILQTAMVEEMNAMINETKPHVPVVVEARITKRWEK